MSYDYVVVGAGMFGASFARTMTDRGKKVLVVEKRDHVGGMCRTELREGIVFHRYGPHVFHTNSEEIWTFVNRFARFEPFVTRTKAMAQGRLFSFPVNLMTLHQLWGVQTPNEAEHRLAEARVEVQDPWSIKDWVLSTYGKEIYELFFLGYTRKQWGRDPAALPASIARRLPSRLSFEDAYFSDRYEGIPAEGYGPLFDRMLEGIEVRLECDFVSDRAFLEGLGRVVYSGRIDEYFDYRFGELAFRTCRFETELKQGDFQGNPVVNYCDLDTPWTRIVEHKHFANRAAAKGPKTLITREYPEECGRTGIPLYPVNDPKNLSLLAGYTGIPTQTIFAGRLGSYRYFDMGEVIAQAWKIADSIV